MKKTLQLFSITLLIALAPVSSFAQGAPAPTACMADFNKVADDSEKIYLDGIAKKTINSADGAAYKKRNEALVKKFKDAVADKKLTLSDCSALLKTANEEKTAVTKLANTK